jgi:hypothetical protein
MNLQSLLYSTLNWSCLHSTVDSSGLSQSNSGLLPSLSLCVSCLYVHAVSCSVCRLPCLYSVQVYICVGVTLAPIVTICVLKDMKKVKGKIFPVLNLAPRHEDVLGERTYSSTNS